jgi:hypothetical protein
VKTIVCLLTVVPKRQRAHMSVFISEGVNLVAADPIGKVKVDFIRIRSRIDNKIDNVVIKTVKSTFATHKTTK